MDYKSKTANDKEISIYYFSATGNSLKLSQDIAAAFGGAGLFRMTPSAGITASDSRIVGFIFPVYMGGLPGIVRRFLESYPFRKGVYYFSIGTYYTYKAVRCPLWTKSCPAKACVWTMATTCPP